MKHPDLLQELLAVQNDTDDTNLLKEALAIESVTGNETPFAEFLGVQLRALQLSVETGSFLKGRKNVWAAHQGVADQPRLMFVGHTDTVHVRGWAEHWKDDPRSDAFAGIERDGHVWARGASDLKGGICAAIAGLRLLQTAGYEPLGGITFAFIGDEESGEPGTGVSAGAKDLVKRVEAGQIKKPDFAVYVEPTNLDVYTAQIGFFIADITLTGKSAYFGTPELGIDAFKATHAVLSQIWEHESELSSGPAHDLVGTSSILVTGMEGGGYIAVPGECKLSLIRKLRPGEDLDNAVSAFEAALSKAELADGVTLTIDYPAGRDHKFGGSPVEISTSDPGALLMQDCVKRALPDSGNIGGAPYWSESPFLINQIGCPAIYCAPGDIAVAHTYEERIEVAEYLAAIRANALFMAEFCGVRRKNQQPTGEIS
ncbi:M20 family metallopeptidase [Falsihalocynthiibacter sp. SS001]|uniref:M20 family metallopeptidase n=1 Tax=Falsihalocynthiibacter sp. SS001 TaxID=3349698 RepID=UPI0036D319E2